MRVTWRAALHALLVRRYPDARDLRRLVEHHLNELAADLPPEAPAKRLADAVIDAAKSHGCVPDLLSALRDAGDDDEALAQIVADYLVGTADPGLAQKRGDYAAHALRVARRPPLEELLGYLLDIRDFDLERVFIPLTARPPAPPAPPAAPPANGPADARLRPSPGPAVAVTDLWPAQEPWLLLVGEPGSGKSILTRWLTAQIARCSDRDRIPVRIELRRYAAWAAERPPERRSFSRFVEETHREDGIPLASELPWLALAGHVVWLIDGLDEVSDPVLRSDCAARIAALRRRGGLALVTSRPRGVTSELALLEEAGLARRELCPLDDPQIHELHTRWHEASLLDDHARARVCARIPDLRELMRSPLVATLILVLARHGEIPRTRQRLLAEVLALVVDRWPKHRDLQFDAHARGEFLRHLAWSMLTAREHGNDNLIDRAALLRTTRDFLRRCTPNLARGVVETQADRLTGELVTQVHVLADLGGGHYGFAHRSFLEFYAADALADAHHDGDRGDIFATRWRAPAWSEVLQMTCGLLAERACALAALALARVFAALPSFDSSQLVAASEFTVRALAEVDDLAANFLHICDRLTDLWIALEPLGGLDLRGLAAALRTIGPRWPAAARLLAHVRATGGRATVYGISEGPGLSSSGPMPAPTVSLALAVATADQRPSFLRQLARWPGALTHVTDALLALGPWTPGERDLLAATFGQHGWDWDERVLDALGDLAGSALEAAVADQLKRSGEFARISAAVTLLSSSALRPTAVQVLCELSPSPDTREDPFYHGLFTRLHAAFRRLDVPAARGLATALRTSGSPGLRAVVELWLAAAGDDEATGSFTTLLRSADPIARMAANWALAQSDLPDAVDRVLAQIGDDLGCLELVWAVEHCAVVAEQRGRWALAEALWRHLADAGRWSPSSRWRGVAMLLRRPAWRAEGLARLPRVDLELPPNSPNMDTALRALVEHDDGPALLRDLLAGDPHRRRLDVLPPAPHLILIDPDTLCRRFIAQVLLEHDPSDAAARGELRAQAEVSTNRHDQHVLAHLMRRLGLPRADWEALARKIPSHVPDPISRCAAAILLGDRDELQRLADAASPATAPEPGTAPLGNLAGVSVLAATLLRCESLRARLGSVTARDQSS